MLPHPIPLLGNLGISLHSLKSETLPYSQKTGLQERGNPGWRAEEQEHKDTDLENRHAHTDHRARMVTQTHRPSPVPEAWEDELGIRVIFPQALALFYLATEGVETLHAPCQQTARKRWGRVE